MPGVRTLCVQLQPRRAAGLRPQTVTALMSRVATAAPELQSFSFERGNDRGPYINYCFSGRALGRIWARLQKQALAHPRIGSGLRRAVIVTCEGSRGWKNYLLLHHFDNARTLDTLSGI